MNKIAVWVGMCIGGAISMYMSGGTITELINHCGVLGCGFLGGIYSDWVNK